MNHISNVKVHLKTRSGNVNIDVCIPTFNRLVFMNSQTVCLFWKEKSSNMDGFSFHLVFFYRKLEGLYNIHLNENSKRT